MSKHGTASRSAARVAPATAAILLVPWVAMRFTDEVVWGVGDFLVAGILLFGTGLTHSVAARRANDALYRIAVGVAVGSALLLVWVNLAVGIIGDEGNPANAMYPGVLAVGIIGALIARLDPHRMARALLATAVAQALVAVIALVAVEASGGQAPSPVLQILGVNGMFVALFLGSAWLFRRAARRLPSAAVEPGVR
jgi:Kef-type K+ transport system membrane component KefB